MFKALAVLRTLFLVFIVGYAVRVLPWGWSRTFDEEYARCTATRAIAIQAAWMAIAWIAFDTLGRLVARDPRDEVRGSTLRRRASRPSRRLPAAEPPGGVPCSASAPSSPASRSWLHRRDVTVWYDPLYRLPHLRARGDRRPRAAPRRLRRPGGCASPGRSRRAASARRAGSPTRPRPRPRAELLDSPRPPGGRSRTIFAVDPSDVPVDEVMTTVRLACGGTLAGARESAPDQASPR